MLHLFNKVYLDFDSKIEINLDRVVISEQNGYPIYQALGLVAQGELFAFEKSLDSIAPDFIAFLISSSITPRARSSLIYFAICGLIIFGVKSIT